MHMNVLDINKYEHEKMVKTYTNHHMKQEALLRRTVSYFLWNVHLFPYL